MLFNETIFFNHKELIISNSPAPLSDACIIDEPFYSKTQ